MATSRVTHPEDLLEAFALDALEPDEEQTVLDHIEDCLQCAALVEDNLLTSAELAYTVPAQAPPGHLRTRILAAVELSEPETPRVSVTARRPSRGWAGVYSSLGSRWARVLMPVTAVAAVAVVAIAIAFNVQISGQMDDMKAENNLLREEMDQSRATAAAQLALASDSVSQMQGSLQLLQTTLAQPGNQSVLMDPMQPNSQARGVLVMSGEGDMGVIMASHLDPLEAGSAYHVWFMQGENRMWAGDMDVDENGWGTLALDMENSLSQFDTVQLTRGPLSLGSVGIAGDIVLEAVLP